MPVFLQPTPPGPPSYAYKWRYLGEQSIHTYTLFASQQLTAKWRVDLI